MHGTSASHVLCTPGRLDRRAVCGKHDWTRTPMASDARSYARPTSARPGWQVRLSAWFRRLLQSDTVLRAIEVMDRRAENRMAEFGMIGQAMEFAKINGVVGDYFEFGLWQGKTFKYAHTMKRRYGVGGMKLRGFDSFAGLPAAERGPDEIWQAGQFAFSRPELERELARSGLCVHEYELVEGFYDTSLDAALAGRLQAEGVKVAIAYIDCDLYESTRDVLRFLDGFLQNGSIVCFDDYYNYKGAPDQGEARALAEFLRSSPHLTFIPYFPYAPLGQSFIVRVAHSAPLRH